MSATTNATTSPTTSTTARRGATVAAATVLPAAAAALARALGVDFTVAFTGYPSMAIGLPLVLATALGASAVGWLSLGLLERVTPRGRGIWTAAAIAVLVVSLLPVWQVQAAGSTKATLTVLHVLVAAILIPGLTLVGRGRR